jgi:hypothetical protein
MVRWFLIAKTPYPCVDFAFGMKSRQRPGVFLKRVFRWAGGANDRPLTIRDELHSIAFFQAQPATNLKRNCDLAFAADGAARWHLYL